ncbi:MAG: YitT family protein, partial [Clostridiales bacterium]|nr:YitT family protein [Clostridiales bacterium]
MSNVTDKKSKRLNRKDFLEYVLITFGICIMSLGIYFFKFPNHFSTGGVTGIAVVLEHYFPNMSAGTLVMLINNGLLIVGFLVFGKNFGVRTAYASLLFSATIWLLEKLVPIQTPLTTQPLLELVFSVTLPAVGSAILFNLEASSGGTDIVAMILKKYTSLNIGVALLIGDFFITIASALTFGIEIGMFSLLGLLIKSMVLDMVLE